MKLIQRIGYYLGGFALGLIFLAFFLTGKRTSCAYGPEARVIKNINSKPFLFSDKFQESMTFMPIDSIMLRKALLKGSVDFSESDTRHEPCGIYMIETQIDDKDVHIELENCDSLAKLIQIKWLNN